jgi:hypothetical protein
MGLAQTYRLIVGAFVLTSAALGYWVHPGFYWGMLFVGANLFQSGLTNWCPLLLMLRRAGLQN